MVALQVVAVETEARSDSAPRGKVMLARLPAEPGTPVAVAVLAGPASIILEQAAQVFNTH